MVKGLKDTISYLLMVGGGVLLIYFLIVQGGQQEVGVVEQVRADDFGGINQIKETLHHNIIHPLAILLLQIITVIAVARVFSFLFRKIGQPSVIGEIVAGIFLGPSFVGYFLPEFSTLLFPPSSIPNLQFLSQIGLILFMFIVGMELDFTVLRKRAKEALFISHTGIILTFSLGVVLAYYLFADFAPEKVAFLPFSLFMGVALSITAFPVLARIVQERQISKTRLGLLIITSAAIDDITAWCLLAAVIAVVKAGSVVSSLYTIVLAITYVILMFKVVQPFLKRIGDINSKKDFLDKNVVAIFFVTLLISSYLTEVIGIHALFGAFIAGVIMPPNMHFRNIFVEKVEDVSLVLLLPLFFVFTGLRTQIGLLNDISLWKICAVIILAASLGKYLGSGLAARFAGNSWKDSALIGALMNTRGLMELVVLNIGLDLGVLSPQLFAMMVIMALVTTFMTGPALDFIDFLFKDKSVESVTEEMQKKFRLIFSFGDPERGKSMVILSDALLHKEQAQSEVTAMHLRLSNELHQYNMLELERDTFKPIKSQAGKLDLTIKTAFKPTVDIDKEIVDTANDGQYDLLIIGMGPSIYEGTLLGRVIGITSKIINPERLIQTLTGKENIIEGSVFNTRVNNIIKTIKGSLGIFIDKGLKKSEMVFIPILSENDLFLLNYAHKVITNKGSKVVLVDALGIFQNSMEFKEKVNVIEKEHPYHLTFLGENTIEKEFLSQQDLMLISIDSWRKLVLSHSEWLVDAPSALIIKE